jgi:nucleotide-binding universal stress UspA family protein
MKTILVLTDFSVRANHAALYALKLAQKIKANLLLCNIISAPVVNTASALTGCPIGNYEDLEEDSINDLRELAYSLSKRLSNNALKGEFKPAIEQCCKAGPIADTINEIASTRNILMAVISMHGADGLSSFLLGDHASEIIENADCPVLVIPYQVPFKGFAKISFATDLTHNGMEILHSLYGLTKYFDSEILITHVADQNTLDTEKQDSIDHFFNHEASEINFPKIYYRAIKSNSVAAGLDWITEHTDIDLLVLVHHKRNFFQKIFEGSVTQTLADHLHKPILVFPYSQVHETLPVL